MIAGLDSGIGFRTEGAGQCSGIGYAEGVVVVAGLGVAKENSSGIGYSEG